MIANHIAEAWKCKLMVLERQIGSLVDKLDLGPSNHISNKNCDGLNDSDLHRLMNLMLLLQLTELFYSSNIRVNNTASLLHSQQMLMYLNSDENHRNSNRELALKKLPKVKRINIQNLKKNVLFAIINKQI